MAPCTKIFCLLLICGTILVNVESFPRKASKSDSSKPKYHNSKPNHVVHQPIKPSKHNSDYSKPSGHQKHDYPTSHGHSGLGSATKPPVIHHTQPPYRPPVHEIINKPIKHVGDQSVQHNTYPGGSGHNYPSSPKPPAAPSYPSNGGMSGGSNSYPPSNGQSGNGHTQQSPPKNVNHGYPQSSPKPPAAPSYPSNGGMSGGSNSYPPSNGQSGNGHTQQSPPKNVNHGYPQSSPKPPAAPSYPNNGGMSGGSNSYPPSNGQSGSGHTQQSPPKNVNHGYPQSSPKPPAAPSYPNNGGMSGGTNSYPLGNGHTQHQQSGPNNVNQSYPPSSPKPPSYPNNGGMSGGTNSYPLGNTQHSAKNVSHQSSYPSSPKPPGSHQYPTNNGSLSGGGYIPPTQKPQPHSYPTANGLSGPGHTQQTIPPINVHKQPYIQPPPSQSGVHSYPPSNGQSGGGHKYPQQGQQYPHSSPILHTGHVGPSYNNHIYVRNQQTNYIHNNIKTTHIHHHYQPPQHVQYVYQGSSYHYPVYREELPVYVHQYYSSPSRFNTLLTGLALYNLGHVSKNRDSHHYHNNYVPRRNEICKFGVKYNHAQREEVDIDCRLITDFIWSLQHTDRNPMAPSLKQVLYPNGTLAQPQIIPVENTEIVDALDPRFNGAPLSIQPGMKCYMKYSDGYYFTTEKFVDCGLLQTYVKTSFNSARKIGPAILMVITSIALALLN